jgi:hypothetical protein
LLPSTGYGLLLFCCPAPAMASCCFAAQYRLWPPVALLPSTGYGLLLFCCPAPAMASCCFAAQHRLWPPRPWSFMITQNDVLQSVGLLWTSDQPVAETSTWQHLTYSTDKHRAFGGIRTHDRSRRAVVDLRLTPRGYWNWPIWIYYFNWQRSEEDEGVSGIRNEK